MTAAPDEEFAESGIGSGGARPVRSRLPRPRTSFVGREYEIAEVRSLLQGNRLLTLTGPGGCGKTRLAIALAAGVTDRFAQGVQFVSLGLRGEVLTRVYFESQGKRPYVVRDRRNLGDSSEATKRAA